MPTAKPALVGVDGLSISGAITVRLNNSGQAHRQARSCCRPIRWLPCRFSQQRRGRRCRRADRRGWRAGRRAGPVQLSGAKVEEFSAGFNEAGEIDPDTALTISAAGMFTVSGAVSFIRTPTGRINVDMPQAAVAISIPEPAPAGCRRPSASGRGALPFRRAGRLPA
jgi:hypothetical protein